MSIQKDGGVECKIEAAVDEHAHSGKQKTVH